MVAHRNCLSLLITLSAFMFFGSVQASEDGKNTELPGLLEGNTPIKEPLKYAKSFFSNVINEGMAPESKTIKTQNGNVEEKYFSVLAMAVKGASLTVGALIAWKVMAESMPILIDYLVPNTWPFEDFKEQDRLNRERKKTDQIIAQYEHEEKVKKFMERTGITDIKDLMKKAH